MFFGILEILLDFWTLEDAWTTFPMFYNLRSNFNIIGSSSNQSISLLSKAGRLTAQNINQTALIASLHTTNPSFFHPNKIKYILNRTHFQVNPFLFLSPNRSKQKKTGPARPTCLIARRCFQEKTPPHYPTRGRRSLARWTLPQSKYVRRLGSNHSLAYYPPTSGRSSGFELLHARRTKDSA